MKCLIRLSKADWWVVRNEKNSHLTWRRNPLNMSEVHDTTTINVASGTRKAETNVRDISASLPWKIFVSTIVLPRNAGVQQLQLEMTLRLRNNWTAKAFISLLICWDIEAELHAPLSIWITNAENGWKCVWQPGHLKGPLGSVAFVFSAWVWGMEFTSVGVSGVLRSRSDGFSTSTKSSSSRSLGWGVGSVGNTVGGLTRGAGIAVVICVWWSSDLGLERTRAWACEWCSAICYCPPTWQSVRAMTSLITTCLFQCLSLRKYLEANTTIVMQGWSPVMLK